VKTQYYTAATLDGFIADESLRLLLPRRITTPPLQLREARAIGGAFVRVRYEVAKRP
jgi:hypothetical protein